MNEKVLHLTLQKKWFDMVASGVKKEEYREIKEHWITRLLNHNPFTQGTRSIKGYEQEIIDHIIKHRDYYSANRIQSFERLVFTNGYSKKSRRMEVECLGIEIREGRKEWGAIEGEIYFVFNLGEVVLIN